MDFRFLNPVNLVRAYRLARAVMKAHPMGQLAIYIGRDGVQPQPPAMKSDNEAPRIDPYVYAALAAIWRAITEAPLIVEDQVRKNGSEEWVQDTTSPLAELLARPNPHESTLSLTQKLILSYSSSGSGYWLLSDDFKEIWHIRSNLVEAQVDNDGYIYAWEVSNDRGQTKTLPFQQVIQVKVPNHLNEYYGFSPVEPIRDAILTNYYFKKYLAGFFKDGAVPGGLLSSEKRVPPERKAEARKDWEKIHKGTNNAHTVAFLGDGFTYQAISPPLKDLAVEAIPTISRDQITAIWGTPPIVMGDWARATFNNSREQIKLFWQNGVVPNLRIFEESFTRTLLPIVQDQSSTRSPREKRVRFNVDAVLALQPDMGELIGNAGDAYQRGMITLNESREMIGYAEVAGGEAFFTPQAGVMISPNGDKSSIPAPGSPPILIHSPAPALQYRSEDPDYNLWTSWLVRTLGYERRLKPGVHDFFDAQLADLLDKLYRYSGGGRSMSALFVRVQAKDDFFPGDLGDLFDIDKENKRLQEIMGPLIFELVESAGQEAAVASGISIDFSVSTQAAQDFINGMVNKMKDVNQTTWDTLLRILTQGEQEGWTVQEMANQIKQWPSLFDNERALRVVRTESTTIANGSSFEAWRQAGIPGKRWIASMDEATRLSHIRANNKVVPLGTKFQLDGGLADYPGDYRLPAAERINCRCTMAPAEELPEEDIVE